MPSGARKHSFVGETSCRGHIAANQGCLRHQLVVCRYHVVLIAKIPARFASLNGRYVARGQRRASYRSVTQILVNPA
ncbi:Uncharacterised protein [Mycobacterium tuberculosis]|nr:Uncharacterised protein [Mycobacterium tuberculosis]CKT15585.1 Uncharacterised protein [Mycobacterium tuberculosis]COV48234.1 Uncharacterised protein [Mycobacterium tuberculosis]